jgi:hypothetical protein
MEKEVRDSDTNRSQRTIGELIFAIVLSAVVAAIAAAAGFVGAAFLCAKLLSGEAGEAALVLDPAVALVLAAIAFSICFRKLITNGESS